MQRNLKGQFIKRDHGQNWNGYGIWFDKKGYPCIYFAGKNIKLHVYIWELSNGGKPKDMEIHHKDFNKQNYDIKNLELLSKTDHRRIHAGWIRVGGIWTKKPCNRCNTIYTLDNFYERKGYTPSALCKKCHNEIISIKNSDPEKQKRIKDYKKEWYKCRRGGGK